MDTDWFYLELRDRRGPVDLPGLLKVLLEAPEPRDVKIWREGLAGWQDAGSVIEVAAKLPPAAPPAPVRAPQPPVSAAFANAELVTTLYRRLMLAFVANYAGAPFFVVLAAISTEMTSGSAELLALFALAGLFGTFAWVLVASYALMQSIGCPSPRVRVAAMFVPVVKLFILLGVFRRANAWCGQHGVKVGLLGPKRKSLEPLRHAAA
jgi:hypothetical protein